MVIIQKRLVVLVLSVHRTYAGLFHWVEVVLLAWLE